MTKKFPVYEVGSLPKLAARVKAIAADPRNPINDQNLSEFQDYARLAGVDVSEAFEILRWQKFTSQKLGTSQKKVVIDANARINIGLQESAGLDFVWDGETRRSEMYNHVASKVDGFAPLPEMIRSRGPDSWRAHVCISEPRLKEGSIDDVMGEINFVRSNASRQMKVPIDDPYMVANMSDNRFYMETLARKYSDDPKGLRYEAKKALTLALAKNVIRPQVEAAVAAGAKFIQLDIPSATIDIKHVPIMVDGINAVVDGIEDVKFSLHICYPIRSPLTRESGYELLFPHVLDLKPSVGHFSLELANGDQYERDLAVFAKYQDQRRFEIGAGLVDITLERQQSGQLETPETVRDRIAKVVNALKDPSLVYVAPDCGLRQLSIGRSFLVYQVLVQGAELARRG